MTSRGRLVLALGFLVYAAAWIFGSKPLYPVAIGLLLAVVVAWAWVGLANRPLRVRRRVLALDNPVGLAKSVQTDQLGLDNQVGLVKPVRTEQAGLSNQAVLDRPVQPGRPDLYNPQLREGHVLEGGDVRVELVVEPTGRVLPAALGCVERLGRLGERDVELRRAGRALRGGYELRSLPRGRYAFGPVELGLEDPFGLYRVEVHEGEPEALLVYPRLAELDRVFAEGGAHMQDGRRLLLRRPSGFDLHSVREYEQGESLRKVHWRTTARRGQLMVKELEDAPRDEIAVLLDGEVAQGFDLAVRAAGSILRSYVRRGRRCVLVVNSALREVQAVHSEATEWRRALELLAGVEPTATGPASALLSGESNPAARALELVVVTARPTPGLVDRLVQRMLSRRGASLVHVDTTGRPEPGLVRLQAVGVPVAVVRERDDLAAALGAAPVQERARA